MSKDSTNRLRSGPSRASLKGPNTLPIFKIGFVGADQNGTPSRRAQYHNCVIGIAGAAVVSVPRLIRRLEVYHSVEALRLVSDSARRGLCCGDRFRD